MYEQSKTAQVINEMQRYKLVILEISECPWTGSVANNGVTILYPGKENVHTGGVAIIIQKERTKTLLEWEPINDRLIRTRFNLDHCKLSVIQHATHQKMMSMMKLKTTSMITSKLPRYLSIIYS